MIEQVLNASNMQIAYKQIMKNKGSGGVDGMRLPQFSEYLKEHWEAIACKVRNQEYQPQAILGVEIPKSNGKTRLLGIPTLIERLLNQAVNQVLSPIFEPDFRENSYGFRPGRNAHQAVKKAQQNINEGYQYILDIDLRNFFDEVQHERLLELIYRRVKCPQTLRLIRKWLKAPMFLNGKLIRRKQGIPQGSPLSPLLSNIVLNELDKELEKRGHRYVRYADDFSIYLKSKQSARRVGNSIYLFLEQKLKLPINREKSGIRRPVSFTIFGYKFASTYKKGDKGKYQLIVDEKPWNRLKEAIKSITRKTSPLSFDERVKRLKLLQNGWINYFRHGSILEKLKRLDEWSRNRLRCCIWHDWKKPERKRKNLVRLGIKPGDAYAWSRTRMGRWAVACSPIMRTTITIERLESRGYQSMATYYLKVTDA